MDEVNFYRAKRLACKKWLLTTDTGDWVALSEKKYLDFVHGTADVFTKNVLRDKNIIISPETRQQYAERLRERYSHLFRGASLFIVALTKRCNLSCYYCHAKATNSGGLGLDMDRQTCRKAVDFIFQTPSNAVCIEFQGGEPLLNFGAIQEITLYAKKKNQKKGKDLRFALVTNLSLMDDEKLAFIKKHRIGLCTSLDGPAAVHDKNRQYPDGRPSHAEVLRWIKRIKKDYPLEALMVTTKHSLKHPREIIDEYARLGFSDIQLRPMLALGYMEGKKEYSAREYILFWKKAMGYLLKLNRKTYLRDRFAAYILKRFFGQRSSSFVDLNSPCGAAISTMAVDHAGGVYSCDEGRQYEMFRLGSVDMRYSDIFRGSECQALVRSTVNDCLLCDACVWKPFCGICVVCSYANYGNLLPVLSKDDRCKILMAQYEYLMEKIIEDKNNETFVEWVKGGRIVPRAL